jgi:cation-transporting P-type ATPase E
MAVTETARDATPTADGADRTSTPPSGLTATQVAERRAAGLGNTPPPATSRTYREIVTENVFTFVNNVLFVLGIALVLVGRPVDALVSLGVISTNIIVGIVQEVRAKRTLDRIALLTRPSAHVVREGKVTDVPPEDLVVGDLLAIEAGDQVVVDGAVTEGRFEVDESQLTGESDVVVKTSGATVFSGSFATGGRGRYEARTVGAESLAGRITAGARTFRRTLTPLQGEIQGVIRVTLGIVLYLQLLLILNNLLKEVPLDQAVIEATVLVGLIPNGLFVSIAIGYALAAVRLSRVGALVQQANAVESLSHVDTLCVDKTGTLTANRLELEAIIPLDGDEASARAAIGMMVASSASLNKTSEALAAAIKGEAREAVVEVPFSSARKWSAVCLPAGASGDAAPGGVFAMGAPTFVKPYLASDEEAWRSIEGRVAEQAALGLRVLLAVHASEGDLFDKGDESRLPEGCRPYAIVVLRDVLRADAAETLARFREIGVDVRVISGDDPETVATLARQAGLDTSRGVIEGPELAALDDAEFAATVERTAIFGRITPEVKERIVGQLRDAGRYVAMTGDGVNDVLSLKRSNLAIAMGSGSQATRGVADLILLDDGFGALAAAIGEGQRILNGMQDILRVFLTRILTVGLLIISALVIGIFPVDLRNASAITLFTVGIPSALLAIWARPGRDVREPMQLTLARFVVPAAALASLIGLLVLTAVLLLGQAEVGEVTGTTAESAQAAARSAVTTFLVYAGLLLLVFVEPPIRRLAVVVPLSPDRRPTYLAIALGIGYLVVMAVPLLRQFFALQPPTVRDSLIVLAGVVGWTVGVWLFWRYHVVDRFLGLPVNPATHDAHIRGGAGTPKT